MEPLRRIFGWRPGFGNKDIEAVGAEHLSSSRPGGLQHAIVTLVLFCFVF